MTWQDIANGLFELGGAIGIWAHVVQMHKDKLVRGIQWKATALFTAWGFWNLYYYPHLDQWASFLGGLTIVAGNVVWLGQTIYYLRRERNATEDQDEESYLGVGAADKGTPTAN